MAEISPAQQVLECLKAAGKTLAVAESLTGGAVANAVVNIPGASAVFRGGAVTYATETKAQVLGVDSQRLATHGPVDEQVACEMAAGVAKLFGADVAVATTGVAGPGPADGHEAGDVWIGVWISGQGARANFYHFSGSRADVRSLTVGQAFRDLLLNFQGC